MDPTREAFAKFSKDVSRLVASGSTTETSYYPALRDLFDFILSSQKLPFDVRAGTSESRRGSAGTDLPDIAFYDGAGDYPVVLVEVKLPTAELDDMVASTERNDQIGRYLARTSVVILSNVRSIGLVSVDPAWRGKGAVPPSQRRLEQRFELWPTVSAMKRGRPPDQATTDGLVELVEAAATRYAPISEPESLARILARQARLAKADLPAQFGQAVQDLADDFGRALGISFAGPEGEEFFRSSLIQTAFYGLFAGWTLWHRSKSTREFRWEDLSEYLRIPFLGSLFHEFRHPERIKDLRLAVHLDRAVETLSRVNREAFFNRFQLPGLRDQVGESKLKVSPGGAFAAIIYFYEPFLESFDPGLRKDLGVWYTPPEIVRYQVRRIDQLLRSELGCTRGFADEKVVVLDPCCGTGAYLIEVLHCIAEQLDQEGVGSLLGATLLKAVSTRVLGFEILTAPFVVAQLQLYLLLADVGAAPGDGTRPGVFLTNALTGWEGTEKIKLHFPELQEEHDAARKVKQDAKIIVVLGNPPYNRFAGAAMDEESDLVDYYKGIRRSDKGKQVGQSKLFTKWGVRKHLLDDLYIRFFRLAEKRIGERAQFGIVSLISNSSFLGGRSHPIMRESLLSRFQQVFVDDLHGNRLASERTPSGESCETVFNMKGGGPGIKVGTCITTWIKTPTATLSEKAERVEYRSFWGRAEAKRRALLESLSMEAWPKKKRDAAGATSEGPRPYERITPTESGGWKLAPLTVTGGYEDWASLDEIFPTQFMGVHTGKDGAVLAQADSELRKRFAAYCDPNVSDLAMGKMCAELMKPANEYKDPSEYRQIVLKEEPFPRPPEKIHDYVYRPLDKWSIWYDTTRRTVGKGRTSWSGCLVQRYGEKYRAAIAMSNEFLISVPQPRRISESRPLFASSLVDLHLHDRGSVCFPAWNTPEPMKGRLLDPVVRQSLPAANLAPSVWSALADIWKLEGELTGPTAMKLVSELFRFALAVMHSPHYQADHAESLAQGWARIPIPRDRRAFDRAVVLGERIRTLLDPLADAQSVIKDTLGKSAASLAVPEHVSGRGLMVEDLAVTISFYGAGAGGWRSRAAKAGDPDHSAWGQDIGDLYLSKEMFLRGVPASIWSYELGGYPVLKKWLGYREAKRREGRPLTLDELDHLRGMVQRIGAMLVLHESLDVAYESCASAPLQLGETPG